MRRCQLYCPGRVPYEVAWEWQRSLLQARRADPSLDDVLLLLEHPPVYTLGYGASDQHLRFDPKTSEIPLYRIERGGDVTHHCPGQLVGYPILNLRHYQPDLHWYLRQLEEVIIQVIGHYGLVGDRISGLTGVWVNGYKVAAIGIKVTRWITMHGFSLNVCPDLAGFRNIVPCGIGDRPVGTLAQFVPTICPTAIQTLLLKEFATVFGVSFHPIATLPPNTHSPTYPPMHPLPHPFPPDEAGGL